MLGRRSVIKVVNALSVLLLAAACAKAPTVKPSAAGARTPRPELPTVEQCPRQAALDWISQINSIVTDFRPDWTDAAAMLADTSVPIDTAKMTDIHKRNVSRETALAYVTTPPCLQAAHDKFKSAFADYSAMYLAMSENDQAAAWAASLNAKHELDTAYALVQEVAKQNNFPLP